VAGEGQVARSGRREFAGNQGKTEDWLDSALVVGGIYVRLLARSMLLFAAIQAPGAGALVFIGYAAHAGGCCIAVVSAILGCLGPGGADPLIEAISGFGGGYRDAIRGIFRWLPY
jgi:hypothetical protein